VRFPHHGGVQDRDFDRLSGAVYIAARAGAVDCTGPRSTLFTAWPVCPVHRLGVHAEDLEEAAVWWCSGGGGHVVTAIGEWHGR
jgi:hypothetical protein